jgi:hypothetical protein
VLQKDEKYVKILFKKSEENKPHDRFGGGGGILLKCEELCTGDMQIRTGSSGKLF